MLLRGFCILLLMLPLLVGNFSSLDISPLPQPGATAVLADEEGEEHHSEQKPATVDDSLDVLDIFGWGGVIIVLLTASLTLSKRVGVKFKGQLKTHQTIGMAVPLVALVHGVTAFNLHPEWETHQLLGLGAATSLTLAAFMGWRMGKGKGRQAYLNSRMSHVILVIVAVAFMAFHVLGSE